MAVGLPVISTKVGYVKTYIKSGFNGLFFPKKNSYVLKQKIEVLLNNKKLRDKLGVNARKTILKKFKWSKTVQEIDNILSKI